MDKFNDAMVLNDGRSRGCRVRLLKKLRRDNDVDRVER